LQEIEADPAARSCPLIGQLEQFFGDLFAGQPVHWTAIAWPTATPFRLRVWRALCAIPPGQTLSYGACARQLGCPGGARAVGQACGANPLPLFVPCHRVVPAAGGWGGFSSGTAWKQWLLQQERAVTAKLAPTPKLV